MNTIQNNPYRILGVYSNSPIKERVANLNRMKAFLRVGQPVPFPLDLPQFLSSISRTEEIVAKADAELTLPKDQMLYAQFWFIRDTPLDEVAFNNLINGDMTKAEEIWKKKECASSLQNRIVCALIRKDYALALSCAETLYNNASYVNQFISAVVGTGVSFNAKDLAFSFLDVLCEEVGASKLLPYITDSIWEKYIGEKSVEPLIDTIQEAIEVAQKSRGKGPKARLDAGETLMKSTNDALSQLKEFLSVTDVQYQMIADKLGLEILQCGIDYYNDSDEPNAARKAMKLQKYAQSIVVGKMAKDRCEENVHILEKIIRELPPIDVFAEDKAIKDELQKYCQLPDKICYAITLLNNTKPHLQTIKNKLGKTNEYYLKISTQVVSNALHNVIEEVNEAQSIFGADRAIAVRGLSQVKSVLAEAWKATRLMDGFDMETDYKSNNYGKNRSILKNICNQMGVFTDASSLSSPRKTPVVDYPSTSSQNSSGSSSHDGCLIQIIIWAILGFILGSFCESGGYDFFVGFFWSALVTKGIWVVWLGEKFRD